MSCHHHWDLERLQELLGRSFAATWRAHRDAVCADRELSRLGETQVHADRAAQERAWRDELHRARRACRELGADPVECKARVARALSALDEGGARAPPPAREVRRCAREACAGFLDAEQRCTRCGGWTCAACECLDEAPDTHACDPSVRASVAAARADSKPCPGCGVRISRILGCAEMFCTECHTSFDYTTGRPIDGVHNPHLFEARREGHAPRTARAEPPGDGSATLAAAAEHAAPTRLPSAATIDRVVERASADVLLAHANLLLHLHAEVLPRLRTGDGVDDNRDLRIALLLGKLTEAAFRSSLARRAHRFERDRATRDALLRFVEASELALCDAQERACDGAHAEARLVAALGALDDALARVVRVYGGARTRVTVTPRPGRLAEWRVETA